MNKASKAPTYVTTAHILHIGFSMIFMVGVIFESIQKQVYNILYLAIVLEIFELFYPFVFKLQKSLRFVFGLFFVLVFGSVTVLTFNGFVVSTVVILMLLHIFMDMLYIVRPIRTIDAQIRFFCGIACFFSLFQIYVVVMPSRNILGFIREMYLIIHSSVLLSMSFVDDRPLHRAARVPITTRSSTYDPQVHSTASPTKRNTYTTLQID